ncbi:PREDICTED: metallophosphoesterase 1-like isoform X2 [Nelumbo nucifera]|uniref:Metallophosphoesterase 1-like isoform X2 n=1 Tax=Nelumbo nucifera TaxID=4432 RepID=A0A1U8AMZ9_NELNU|nr:PREDICTED: metallophosphoesterase 1-like isoform X2 [Nelumbo nucifera]
MVVWRSALPLIIAVALMTFEHWVTIPSCEVVSRDNVEDDSTKDSGELKVMMVANLLLLGSEAGYTNIYFRDSFTAKFFRKSFHSLKPDMLIVLGDVSARGSDLTHDKWLSVIQQLQRMLGPFLGLPLHIVLGDRDIGECSKINAKFVNRIASNFPGLDSAGCGSFEVSNISFVSLNAVALLCGDNDLRFGVEKIIEKESVDLQTHTNAATEIANETTNSETNFSNFVWRENTMLSGSGPVLLLHFPLHSTLNSNCAAVNALNQSPSPCHHKSLKTFGNRRLAGAGPYDLLHTVPPNETEYIFQALKPRTVIEKACLGAQVRLISKLVPCLGPGEATLEWHTLGVPRNGPGASHASVQDNI